MKQEIIILRTTLKFLKYQIVWPSKQDEVNPGSKFYLMFFLMISSTSLLLFGSVFHLMVSIKENAEVNLSQDVAYIISYIGIMSFICCHVWNIRRLAPLYSEISDFNPYGKPNNFDETNKKLNCYSQLFNIVITLIVLGVSFAPLLEKSTCERLNIEKSLHEICGLQTPTWMPFPIDHFPNKQLYYLLQIYSSMYTMKSAAYISYAVLESTEHVRVRLGHVKDLFVEVVGEMDERKRRRDFAKCVQYHNVVLKYVERLDDSYKMGSMVHIVLTGAVLGCVGYQLIERASVSNLCLLSGWFSSMAFVCIGGQLITDDCQSIGDAIYNNSNWYNTNPSFKKDLLMVMLRARKPVYMHAGPFGQLSFQLMLGIIKTSYSYLALLNQVSNYS